MAIGGTAATTPTATVVFENERSSSTVDGRPLMSSHDRHLTTMHSKPVNSNGYDNIMNANAPSAAECNGCSTMTSFNESRDTASVASSDDVTPTTSSTDSTEKSEVDSAGNNTFAAKKGKAEGQSLH